ncbi:MAG: EamA family transporter [Phaeodactylibacter sp.]|nr:EamA family transporter [Phaeodactylibacter sp.]MCB9303685.1 EamA family transporter [Lewinellaceae bacterium]
MRPAHTTRHLAEIHIAVLLFGLAGLFGKWIALPSTIIVLGRVFFASFTLAFVLQLAGHSFRLARRPDYLYLSLLGILLALHWVTFFESIKVSTVAVGLLAYSTFPIFTVLLEPWFFREKFHGQSLVLAGITLMGVALIIPEWQLANDVTQGVLWGALSGASFALLSILNRRYVRSYSSLQIAFYQDLVAMLVLLPFLWWERPTIGMADWGLLVLLGVVFTAISHTLFINGLKSVPARTASIIASLEPVYGIIAAAFLLGEIPGWRVLLGGMAILSAAAVVTFIRPQAK